MSKGRLTCLGTSHFLKNKFGTGYDLNIVKSDSNKNSRILEFLTAQLGAESGVKVTSEVHNELTIKIPHEFSGKFGDIFNLLDRSMTSLGVVKYSVTYATLEEVYLKVGNQATNPVEKQKLDTSVQIESSEDR